MRLVLSLLLFLFLVFFIDTAPTEIYTLSLHDALPIFDRTALRVGRAAVLAQEKHEWPRDAVSNEDRKSTRLNSSHRCISYAVFCLKKKKKKQTHRRARDNIHMT